LKAAKALIVLLTAFIVVIFTDCSSAEKKETEEIIHAKPVSSSLASKPEPSAEKKPESSVPVIIESNTTEPSRIEFSINNEKLFETLDEYFSADSTKEVIDKIISGAEEGTEKNVYVDNKNTLVFETKIKQELTSGGIDEFRKRISESVNNSKDVFMGFVYELEECIDNDDIRVLVRYIDNDANVIFEETFENGSKKAESNTDTEENTVTEENTSTEENE